MILYKGFTDKICKAVFIITALLYLYTGGAGPFSDMTQRALLITLLCPLVFFIKPLKIKGQQNALTKGIDLLMVLGLVTAGVYLLCVWQDKVTKIGSTPLIDIVMGSILIILILEATRRMVGNAIAITCLAFLVYALLGPYMPTFLAHRGESWDRLTEFLYLTSEGIFGIPAGIAASFIIMFVLFGTFLESFGAGQLFFDVAYALTGRFRGGPAKTAIFASTLMGMISGSSAANVATTGAFTIPLMKRLGYKPHDAAAIEAVASTGGMFTPPVMGAAAFIIAEYLGASYATICLAAVIPAGLYYASLLLTADAIAVKSNMVGMPANELPKIKTAIAKRGLFVIPLLFLVVAIIIGWSAMKVAFWSSMMVLAVAFLYRQNRPKLTDVLQALENGARQILPIVVTCAAAGIIVGIISLTGLGAKLSYTLIGISNGNLIIAGIMAAIITIILGCGMPPTAVYIILAAILVPPLTELGAKPIAAHMFIFMFSCIGAITPPVAITAYTGAAIAKADPGKTGWTAFRFGLVAYIIPFMFLISPTLLFQGEILAIIHNLIAAIVGILCLVASLEGYLIRFWNKISRIILGIAALLLIYPGAVTDLIGLGLIVAAIIINKSFHKEGILA
jgi:TRAP transporter 4TM/12TM fusion protein